MAYRPPQNYGFGANRLAPSAYKTNAQKAQAAVAYQPWKQNMGMSAGSSNLPASAYPGGAAGTPGGAAPIPGAGIYGQQHAAVQKIYENSMAAARTQRDSLYNQAGVGADGKVNPLLQHGGYQMMLQGQGSALDQNLMANQDRGLFGAGLGNQGERALRFGQAADQLDFQRGVGQIGTDYAGAVQSAADQKQSSNLDVQRSAMIDAMNSNDYTPPTAEDALATLKASTVPTNSGAKSGSSGVSWGGQTFTTKASLAAWLKAHGQSYSAWAKRHSAAAAKLR